MLPTNIKSGKTLLVELDSGWTGTPNHPVKDKENWVHPKTLKEPLMKNCDCVFSFLLKNRSTIIINDLESATLAHNLSDNDVIEHSYFGTEKVVEDLKQLNGWDEGLIEIIPECIIRHPSTNYVIGIKEIEAEIHV